MKKRLLGLLLVSLTSFAEFHGHAGGAGQEVASLVAMIEQAGQANAAAASGNCAAADGLLQMVFGQLNQMVAQGQRNPLLQPVERQLWDIKNRLADPRIPQSQRAMATIDGLSVVLSEFIAGTSSLGGIPGALQGVRAQISIAHTLSERALMAPAAQLTSASLRQLSLIVPCAVSGPFIQTTKQALASAEAQMNDPRLSPAQRSAGVCQALQAAESSLNAALAALARPVVMPGRPNGGYPGQGYPSQGGYGRPRPYPVGGAPGNYPNGYPQGQSGYGQGGYQPGYPQAGGYSGSQGGYPGNYPASPGGYQGNYPAGQGGYSQGQGGYQSGYPMQNGQGYRGPQRY